MHYHGNPALPRSLFSGAGEFVVQKSRYSFHCRPRFQITMYHGVLDPSAFARNRPFAHFVGGVTVRFAFD
jgi:hypothetical protein